MWCYVKTIYSHTASLHNRCPPSRGTASVCHVRIEPSLFETNLATGPARRPVHTADDGLLAVRHGIMRALLNNDGPIVLRRDLRAP